MAYVPVPKDLSKIKTKLAAMFLMIRPHAPVLLSGYV